MNIKKLTFLGVTHSAMLAFGFAVGIYALPIMTAPTPPTQADIKTVADNALYHAKFTRELKGSDFLHWGEGNVSISSNHITLQGELAPGPEYRLYLSPAFVETEAEFEQLKSSMKLVGDVKTFDNFMVKVGSDIDLSEFNTLVVWCEAFGEFITSAKYQ